jgi:hypothetical protein
MRHPTVVEFQVAFATYFKPSSMKSEAVVLEVLLALLAVMLLERCIVRFWEIIDEKFPNVDL